MLLFRNISTLYVHKRPLNSYSSPDQMILIKLEAAEQNQEFFKCKKNVFFLYLTITCIQMQPNPTTNLENDQLAFKGHS